MASNLAARKDAPDNLLALFRDKLKARGTRGIIGLKRLFTIMDDDGSHTLSLPEFIKACKDFRVSISEENVPTLFTTFDTNGDGTIDFNEFLSVIRGPFSEKRQDTVVKAYEALLVKFGQDGRLPKDALLASYDVTRHPEIIQG